MLLGFPPPSQLCSPCTPPITKSHFLFKKIQHFVFKLFLIIKNQITLCEDYKLAYNKQRGYVASAMLVLLNILSTL